METKNPILPEFNPNFWHILVDHLPLKISSGSSHVSKPILNYYESKVKEFVANDGNQFRADFEVDGFSAFDGFFAESPFIEIVRALCAAVERLHAAGWPATFVVVFDEAWLLCYAVQLLLDEIFGDAPEKPLLNGDFYAFCVGRGEAGFNIHRDRQAMPWRRADSANVPRYITAWIALSEATPSNGCIYVLPARYDETYFTDAVEQRKGGDDYANDHNDDGDGEENQEMQHELTSFANYSAADIRFQDVRALPAAPGDVLTWTGRVFHFGGRNDSRRHRRTRSSRRVALSVAFSTPSFECAAEHGIAPLRHFRLPSLEERLKLILVQIYLHNEHENQLKNPILDRLLNYFN